MAGFGLGIRYLNGWAMAAADGARRMVAEWPPHPDRVFMALAAAWFETGQDAAEGAALRWLEGLPPPAIAASDAELRHATGGRRPTTSYVPANDMTCARKVPDTEDLKKLKEAGLALLPEHRLKNAKAFPTAVPHREQAFLIWPDIEPGEHRAALSTLASKVTHIGHSASFTQVWVEDQPPPPDWVPTDGVASHRLRTFGPGRLKVLERTANHAAMLAHAEIMERFESAKGKAKKALQQELDERFPHGRPVSRRPEPGLPQGYGKPAPPPEPPRPHTLFDPKLTVLALGGRRLPLQATLKLTEALRGAVQKFCPAPIPEWVSGHAADGSPSRKPHLALAPLSFVGAEHADGRLLGVALVLPRDLDAREAAQCFEPLLFEEVGLPRAIRLYEGKWLECVATIEQRESLPLNLRPETWTRASAMWASTTPVVLDRHFDGREKWDKAAESVKDACERIGLPRPREVLLHPVSMIEGVPHAREFAYLTRKSDGGRMHHSHAVLIFDRPVEGPILLGAGRFRGYGFFRPLKEAGHG